MEEYLRRLAYHANIYLGIESMPWESIGVSLSEAEKTGTFPDMIRYREDILLLLEEANIQINGSQASTRSSPPSDKIPRELSIFVGELVCLCYEYSIKWEKHSLFTAAEREVLKKTIWMIMQGWCLVVAGDFDNIPTEVQLHVTAKEIL